MNSDNIKNDALVYKDQFKSCMESYMDKEESVTDESWLKSLFEREIKGMTTEKAAADAAAIVRTIQIFSEQMKKLNAAEEQGISKESCLAGQIVEDVGSDLKEGGRKLSAMEQQLYQGNMEMAAENGITDMDGIEQESVEGEVEYEPYQIKDMAKNIGKSAAAIGIQMGAVTIGEEIARHIQENEDIQPNEIIQKALESGVDEFVQTIASGALEVVTKNNLLSSLTADTAPEMIATIASVGVKQTGILAQVAAKKMSVTKAVGQYAKTAVAAVGSVWKLVKNSKAGKAVAGLAGGKIGAAVKVASCVGTAVAYLGGTKYGKKIVETGKQVAKAAKNGIKAFFQGAKKGIANTVKNVKKVRSENPV